MKNILYVGLNPKDVNGNGKSFGCGEEGRVREHGQGEVRIQGNLDTGTGRRTQVTD